MYLPVSSLIAVAKAISAFRDFSPDRPFGVLAPQFTNESELVILNKHSALRVSPLIASCPTRLSSFSLYPEIQRVAGFAELPLSNFCGYDNSIVAERASGKHLSLLQVPMCLWNQLLVLNLLIDRIWKNGSFRVLTSALSASRLSSLWSRFGIN